MVCMYCQQKTTVSNSRPQLRTNNVWRRRRCTACQRTVTTIEHVDYEKSFVVQYPTVPDASFLRDKLFVSIYNSCRHRPSALPDSMGLCDTVTSRLLRSADQGVIKHIMIAETVLATLLRFDKAAAVHYQAFHADAL